MYLETIPSPERAASVTTEELWTLQRFSEELSKRGIYRIATGNNAQYWFETITSNVRTNRCSFALFVTVFERHKNSGFLRVLAIAIRAHSMQKQRQ